MNRQFSKAWRNFGWFFLAGVIGALVIFNATALYQASRWRAEIDDLTTRIADVKYQKERNDWIARRVEHTNKRLNYEGETVGLIPAE